MSRFGRLPDGEQVISTVLQAHGLRLTTISWGASVQDLRLQGVPHPLVLGFPTLDPYLTAEGRYFGAIVGRSANRIAGGEAVLDGRQLHLDRNEAGRNTLHGGSQGSGQRNWRRVALGPDHIAYADHLPDGHMGFPGNLLVRATYRLRPSSILEIEILAISTAATLCNFAQHSYFNLDGSDSIRDHELTCPATHYLPVDDALIPLGEPAPVDGTALDFRSPVPLGPRLDETVIDHNLCLDRQRLREPRPVASLQAGRVQMQIETTEPGLQIYTGDHIRPGSTGISGRSYGRNAGIALEPQCWPDAPHHPDYPSIRLEPGVIYHQTTILRFAQQ
jgi:aldose 1-epimerase